MTVDPAGIATGLLAALDQKRQIPTLTGQIDGFGIADAYRVAGELRRLRVARGERPVSPPRSRR